MKIKEIRQKKKMTLQEMGDLLGVSRTRAWQIENSKNLEMNTIRRVADALGVKVKDII